MKTALIALLAALILPWDATASHINDYATSASALGRFSGVVLVARGSDVYRGAFGYADVATRRANTVDTQFEIASLTKMFTAAAILKLRDQGRLKLSDPLCSHLASCPPQWRAITIDQTLHHRSGIPDYEDDLSIGSDKYFALLMHPDNAQRIVQREWAKPLDFPPGTKFSYSNTGYVLLSYVIQNASGQSYARYLHQQLLSPAGMTHTGIYPVDTPRDFAIGYSAPDVSWAQRINGFSLLDVRPRPVPVIPWGQLHGDAALFSTADDLYRWARIMMGKGPQIFSASERAEIFTGQDGYGDGWMVTDKDQFGLKRYRHTGEVPGYLSNIAIYPDRDTVVIMLDNLDTPMAATTRDVNAIAVGEAYDMPVHGTATTLSADEMQRWTGAYKFTDGDTACVSTDRTMLRIAVTNRYVAGLIPMAPDRFYMPLSAGTATFTGAGLTLRYNGVDHDAARVASSCV